KPTNVAHNVTDDDGNFAPITTATAILTSVWGILVRSIELSKNWLRDLQPLANCGPKQTLSTLPSGAYNAALSKAPPFVMFRRTPSVPASTWRGHAPIFPVRSSLLSAW